MNPDDMAAIVLELLQDLAELQRNQLDWLEHLDLCAAQLERDSASSPS